MNLLTKVSAIMSKNLITVTAHTPLAEARPLFDRYVIHHLPVVAPDGSLTGILSQADFLRVGGQDGVAPPTEVGQIMTTGLAKLSPDDPLRTAVSVFSLNKIHALPVVDNNKLIGILTTLDLIRLLDQEYPALDDYSRA